MSDYSERAIAQLAEIDRRKAAGEPVGIADLFGIWEPAMRATDDDQLDHCFCGCDPDVGLCGARIEDAEMVNDYTEDGYACVVCLDLEYQLCPRCGQ